MKKIFERHKYFYLIILALLTLVLGVSFINVKNNKVSEGADCTHKYALIYQAYWKNPAGKAYYGDYENSDRYTLYSKSLGYITALRNPNTSFSGVNSVTYDGNETVDTTKVSARSINCKVYQKNGNNKGKSYTIWMSATANCEDYTELDSIVTEVNSTEDFTFKTIDEEAGYVYVEETHKIADTWEDTDSKYYFYAYFKPKQFDITLQANGGVFADGKETNTAKCYWGERYYNTT